MADPDNSDTDKSYYQGVMEEEAVSLMNDVDQLNTNYDGKKDNKMKNFFTQNGRFPTSIFFIIGNEFCERFSYYGMKTILVIYLTQRLGFHPNPATAIYHGFTMLCYFTPIFGAILADGFLGKFRTILYISLVYALGNIVMALTALPPPEWIGMVFGLLLIGIGTGGIKPCVSAFGGDQFSADQVKEVQSFFSVFYFTINAGSLLSTFLTPILRADVQCFGADCYPLAFGVPAILMILSVVIFFCGRKQYKNHPPTGSLIGRVIKCLWCGLKKKISSEDKAEHWLDRCSGRFEPEFVEEVKCLIKVLAMFLPLPVFWALFDQQGSRWTLQSEQMDGHIVGDWRIKPDQVQVINPILILVFIPIFEKLIYPALDKCRIPNRPLQRMIGGMTIAIAAFVTAGFLQIKLDNSIEKPLEYGESGITIVNALPCRLNVTSADLAYHEVIDSYQSGDYIRCKSGNYSVTIATDKSCADVSSVSTSHVFPLYTQRADRFIFFQSTGRPIYYKYLDSRKKPGKGNAFISVISHLGRKSTLREIMLKNKDYEYKMNISHGSATDSLQLAPGRYGVYLAGEDKWNYTGKTIEAEFGAVYSILLSRNDLNPNEMLIHSYTVLQSNQVSMAYQIPQYVLITVAEVMFSITGLAFAYSQAPASMKSVLQAAWLLTIAGGNLIVLIVAEVRAIPSQSMEFFLFAILMALDVIIFAVMTKFYTYTNQNKARDMEIEDTTGLVNNSSHSE